MIEITYSQIKIEKIQKKCISFGPFGDMEGYKVNKAYCVS